MRALLLAFSLLAAAAEARTCDPPEMEGNVVRGLEPFADCILDEIAGLKREQTDLLRQIEDLKKALADIPGELQNKNGRVTRLGGERLTKASYSLSTRTREGATSLGIDQKALETLCAIGCSVTLSLTAEGLREADTAPVVTVGPCGFSYIPKSGVWALGGACGEPVTGIDGDGLASGTSGGEAIVVADGACTLADSEPSRSVDDKTQQFVRDRAKGLFLVAEPTLWKGQENRFRCELKIVH